MLSDFATNLTRYYNLDLLTGDAKAGQRVCPIRYRSINQRVQELQQCTVVPHVQCIPVHVITGI